LRAESGEVGLRQDGGMIPRANRGQARQFGVSLRRWKAHMGRLWAAHRGHENVICGSGAGVESPKGTQ
jgi:hypothetical protein